jgi:hypothetical protein
MVFHDLGILQQGFYPEGHMPVPVIRAKFVKLLVKGFDRALKAFYHHGTYNIGLREALLQLLHDQYGVGGYKLRPVYQGQPFLGPEFQWL